MRHNKSTKHIVKSHTKTAIMTYNIAKLADFDPALATGLKSRCYTIIGLCQQVHREMGPFLNEYMILYNFAPVHDQCERYYLDKKTGNMYVF